MDSEKKAPPAPRRERKPLPPDLEAAFEASFKRNEEALRRLAKL